MSILLDPSGSGKVGGKVGVNGKIVAYENNNRVVVATLQGVNISSAPYSEYVKVDNGTFASTEEVLDYIQANFKNASSGADGAVKEINGVVPNEEGAVDLGIEDLDLAQNMFMVGDSSNKGSARAILPSDVGLASTGNRIPAKVSGSNEWTTDGYVVSIGIANSAIPIRSATGTLQASPATLTTEVVTLAQLNNPANVNIAQDNFLVGDATGKGSARKILPSDLISFDNRIVTRTNATTFGNLQFSSSVSNSAIVQRTSTGQIKASDPSASDEAVTLGYMKGVTFTGTIIPLTNIFGHFQVASANNATTYTLAASPVIGSYAVVLINATTQPTITGGTLISGSPFTASTNMEMHIRYNGTQTQYFFAKL